MTAAHGAARAWAELLRLPALFTVPGDALAGAATTTLRPNHRTLLAIGSSLCLYEAGMALNDWADRADDAIERPERPLPSGRITPPAALAAATALTATGLALASRAGRPSLTTASALAGTVWAYDLGLKHTPAGPAAMAAARGLDLLLGATATAGPGHGSIAKAAAPSAGVLAAHTLAVTVVSRHEAQGGSSTAPLAALAATAALAGLVGSGFGSRGGPGSGGRPGSGSRRDGHRSGVRDAFWGGRSGPRDGEGGFLSGPRDGEGGLRSGPHDREGGYGLLSGPRDGEGACGLRSGRSGLRLGRSGFRLGPSGSRPGPSGFRPGQGGFPDRRDVGASLRTGRQALRGALALAYIGTAAKPLFHAALNPSPPLTQRAVGGGVRAMIPLQAALAARAGAAGTALLTAALAPAARKFARKVSVT
ncbi:SCO3242 family prenyltransferase [Streptomyces sp. NPDC050732]|uniref:SCO3242 family prenyltransferase n=1 Tax=Streptomyces sp. NPDC050732 TaxID=3154632 RepID=UPI00342D817A